MNNTKVGESALAKANNKINADVALGTLVAVAPTEGAPRTVTITAKITYEVRLNGVAIGTERYAEDETPTLGANTTVGADSKKYVVGAGGTPLTYNANTTTAGQMGTFNGNDYYVVNGTDADKGVIDINEAYAYIAISGTGMSSQTIKVYAGIDASGAGTDELTADTSYISKNSPVYIEVQAANVMIAEGTNGEIKLVEKEIGRAHV